MIFQVYKRCAYVAPIRDFLYHLTDNFFRSCPAHPNPLVRSIGNYTLPDLHRQYKKYIHKRPKHLLLQPFTQLPQCFSFVLVFHCYTYTYLTRLILYPSLLQMTTMANWLKKQFCNLVYLAEFSVQLISLKKL